MPIEIGVKGHDLNQNHGYHNPSPLTGGDNNNNGLSANRDVHEELNVKFKDDFEEKYEGMDVGHVVGECSPHIVHELVQEKTLCNPSTSGLTDQTKEKAQEGVKSQEEHVEDPMNCTGGKVTWSGTDAWGNYWDYWDSLPPCEDIRG